MDSTSQTSEQEADSGVESTNSAEVMVYLRISVPELNMQKCLQFHPDDTVWIAKQQILSTIAKNITDGINYGLFSPPLNGRAGKFLDEERPLKDYPLPGPIGYLEFKMKRRIYKQTQLNPRKLKQVHTKANLKQMMEAVRKCDVNKVTKFINRGLDPNFNDQDTGETPLTVAVAMVRPMEMVLTLVNGGGHLDFRNRKGLTPLHVAAEKGNEEAIRALLDLGSSTNYRDLHGLTALYRCVCHESSSKCVEMLLYDHAVLGIVDDYGWTEIHQSCKAGHVQHLEQLIYYGSDVDSQNSSGNTPLHVCAINNQEECARVLLFRGAKKTILNYANQDAFESAVISGNTHLAIMIKDFSEADVVPYKDAPKYNDKRRLRMPLSATNTLQRCRSNPQLNRTAEEQRESDGVRRAAEDVVDDAMYELETIVLENVGRDKAVRRCTELTHLSEYMKRQTEAPYLCDSTRSLSVSSAGSCPVGEIDLTTPVHSQSDRESMHHPRIVIVHEGTNGFGFVLRGAKAQTAGNTHCDFLPSPQLPALQYFEQVEKKSLADDAGIQPGDFLLEVNETDVRSASHDYTVRLIKESDDVLKMMIQTPATTTSSTSSSNADRHKNLDRFLSKYETEEQNERWNICGSSSLRTAAVPDNFHASLRAIPDVHDDDDGRVASIRSVHGKRLTPAIPRSGEWPPQQGGGGPPPTAIWKAKSIQCLSSTRAGLSVIDEMEKFGTESRAFRASRQSLAPPDRRRDDGHDDFLLQPFRNRSVADGDLDVSTAHRDFSGGENGSDGFYRLLPGRKLSTAAADRPSPVLQSFSYGTAARNAREPALDVNRQNSRAPDVDRGDGRGTGERIPADRRYGPNIPPPPPLPLLPSKPPPNVVLRHSSVSSSSEGRARPVVPERRRSRVTSSVVNDREMRTANERCDNVVAVAPTSSTTTERVGNRDDRLSDFPNFLLLAENARLNFLNRKTGNDDCNLASATSTPSARSRETVAAASGGPKPFLSDLVEHFARLKKSDDVESNSREDERKEFRDDDVGTFSDEVMRSRKMNIEGTTVDDSQTDPSVFSASAASSAEAGDELISVAERKRLYERRNCSPLPLRLADKAPSLSPLMLRLADKSPASSPLPLRLADKASSLSPLPLRLADKAPSLSPLPLRLTDKAPSSFPSSQVSRLPVDPTATRRSFSEDSFPDDLVSAIIPPPPFFLIPQRDDHQSHRLGLHLAAASTAGLAELPPPPPGFEDTPRLDNVLNGRLIQTYQDVVDTAIRPPVSASSSSSRRRSSVPTSGQPVGRWSVEDVCGWLDDIHMGEHRASFAGNGVDGRRLALLGRNELIALGVTQVGQRMTIERAIKKAVMFCR